MKNKRKYITYIFILLIVVIGYVGWILFGPTIKEPAAKYFYISTGSGYQSVKDSLVSKNIISGTFWFDKVAKYLNYDKAIKPGRYKIKDEMSLLNLVRMLRSGNQSPVNLVITRLRTKEDLAKKLGNNFESDSISVIQFLNNNDSLSKYNLDSNTVMTAVIPNTYILKWNNTISYVFRKLFTEQQKFWNEKRRSQAAALNLSGKEVYTLASIVEEETNEAEDKGKIASVYLNRMKKGMRLAADPTVKFAIKDFGLKRIYEKHTRIPSPYNTYLVAGLPPGPICTPSIKTIDAVLNAPSTDYLFFVAKADFSGYSNFASSYEEHMKFAKEYQQALDSLVKAKR
ncbi:MAG: endolytic transglycosylase MltG [Ginsengibacter sp.]